MCYCQGCGCKTTSSLVCPSCTALGRSSFFCTQECFLKNWNIHNKLHGILKHQKKLKVKFLRSEIKERCVGVVEEITTLPTPLHHKLGSAEEEIEGKPPPTAAQYLARLKLFRVPPKDEENPPDPLDSDAKTRPDDAAKSSIGKDLVSISPKSLKGDASPSLLDKSISYTSELMDTIRRLSREQRCVVESSRIFVETKKIIPSFISSSTKLATLKSFGPTRKLYASVIILLVVLTMCIHFSLGPYTSANELEIVGSAVKIHHSKAGDTLGPTAGEPIIEILQGEIKVLKEHDEKQAKQLTFLMAQFPDKTRKKFDAPNDKVTLPQDLVSNPEDFGVNPEDLGANPKDLDISPEDLVSKENQQVPVPEPVDPSNQI
eukprot:GEMP01041557.1.p1 GENE.GEMP01041557.1~~GEMP01041557.1.p1  ORF type:complete len:375 (+),score=69.03 GEMP01041557.1:250-1374(+)